MPNLPDTPLNRYRVRFLEQLLTEATAEYWTRRATTFDRARPRPGDYTGEASLADLSSRDQRCRDTATACLHHADLIRSEGLPGAARDALMVLSEPEAGQ